VRGARGKTLPAEEEEDAEKPGKFLAGGETFLRSLKNKAFK